MQGIFPGVSRGQGKVGSAEEAAARAVELAQVANGRGTFGVGGLLLRPDGTIVAEAVNAVIVDGAVDDPTAHVERQLVDWSLARQAADEDPESLLLVSSLDPCAMCAASIMSVGFKAVAVAEDPVSGVHRCGRLKYVPSSLQAKAETHLRLFEAPGRETAARQDQGLLASPIARSVVDAAEEAFSRSLSTVRRKISAVDVQEKDRFVDDLPSRIDGFERFVDCNIKLVGRDYVRRGRDDREMAGRSVLVDRHGNALLEAQAASTSSTRSSIVEIVRAYGRLRRFARDHHGLHLPHQRKCSILSWASEMDKLDAMLALGAVGSSLEDAPLAGRLPVLGVFGSETASKFQRVLGSMPSLYNDVLEISVRDVSGMARRMAEASVP